MKEITLRELIDRIPENEDLRPLVKKADDLNLFLCEMDTARIKDYRHMTYTSPVMLFTGMIPDDPGRWAVISKRDHGYFLDWYESIREVDY